MDINEDVVINGTLTVNGDIVGGSVKSNADLIMGRDLLIDGQDGKLIDNDSNARLTGVTATTLQLQGNAPTISDATTPADAVTKLNLLLTFLRSSGTIQ
jgi:hypothetical protein